MSKNSVQIQIAKQLPITLNSKISIDDHSVVIHEAVMCGGVTTIRGFLDKETKMNINKLATQAEEVEWKNGDECVHDCIAGFAVVLPEGLFFKPLGASKLFKVNINQLSKPESQEEKEKRERLEAAYDLYTTKHRASYHGLIMMTFVDFIDNDQLADGYLAIADKTNYRKEQ